MVFHSAYIVRLDRSIGKYYLVGHELMTDLMLSGSGVECYSSGASLQHGLVATACVTLGVRIISTYQGLWFEHISDLQRGVW